MMWVDITDFKSALAVENMLTPYKKGRLAPDKKTRLPKEPITPEICMEVLKSTNYARNIKDMLLCIAELPQAEQAQFKEVVLACFSNREQSDDVWNIAEKLAQTSDYLPELQEELNKIYDGRFFYSANYLKEAISTTKEQYNPVWAQKCGKITFCGETASIEDQKELPPQLEFFKVHDVHMTNNDMAGVENIYFRDVNNQVHMGELQNLSAALTFDAVFHVGLHHLDFSHCPELRFLNMHDVSIHNSKGLPEVLDVAMVGDIFIHQSDLESVRQILLGHKHSQFSITETERLPDNMVVENVDSVTLTQSSWREAENITLHNVGSVDFDESFHLPKQINLKEAKSAQFLKTDLGGVQRICCEDVGYVDFSDAKYLPQQIVLKDCGSACFRHCDLTRVASLDLSELSKDLFLDYAVGLPKVIECKKLNSLSSKDADFKGVEKICLQGAQTIEIPRAKNMAAEIVINGCIDADLSGIDFRDVPCLKLRQIYQKVNLTGASNLPQNFALASVEEANLYKTSFEAGASLKLQDIETVNLKDVSETPKMIVVQEVKDFDAQYGDFVETDCLICRNVRKVNLCGVPRLPKKMVFEDCKDVWLGWSKGANLKEIEFKNVKKVYIYENQNYSLKLDFSKVDEVQLDEAHFSRGTELIFKNRQQMIKSDFLQQEGVVVRFKDEEKSPLWNWFGLTKHSRS